MKAQIGVSSLKMFDGEDLSIPIKHKYINQYLQIPMIEKYNNKIK